MENTCTCDCRIPEKDILWQLQDRHAAAIIADNSLRRLSLSAIGGLLDSLHVSELDISCLTGADSPLAPDERKDNGGLLEVMTHDTAHTRYAYATVRAVVRTRNGTFFQCEFPDDGRTWTVCHNEASPSELADIAETLLAYSRREDFTVTVAGGKGRLALKS